VLKLTEEESKVVDEYIDDTVEPLKSIVARWEASLNGKGRIPMGKDMEMPGIDTVAKDKIDKLLEAAYGGHLGEVEKLLSSGVPVDLANDIGNTALMSAVRSYRVEMAVLLIEHGADVNALTSDGQSVLHSAVGGTPSQPGRQAACVEMLLGAGADANAVTPLGHSPLMQAAWFGCSDAVKAFLAHGVDQSLVDTQGRNAEEIARARGHEEIVRLLAKEKNN